MIKGNSSALYGAGAMAGVVNLIARRPTAEPIREFLFNQTTLGGTDASVFYGKQLSPHWGMTLLGSGDWQERKDRDHDGWADLAGLRARTRAPALLLGQRQRQHSALDGRRDVREPIGGTMQDAVLPATGPALPRSSRHPTVRYRRQRANGSSPTATSWPPDSPPPHSSTSTSSARSASATRTNSSSAKYRCAATTGRHTWVIGAAAERDAYRPRDVPRFAYTYITPGVFLQDDLTVTPWLSVSASARADFHNQYGTFFSPRLSALLRWQGWTSRVSAGQGFFAPTPLTEETEAAGLTRLQMPSPLASRARTKRAPSTSRAHSDPSPSRARSSHPTSGIRSTSTAAKPTRSAISPSKQRTAASNSSAPGEKHLSAQPHPTPTSDHENKNRTAREQTSRSPHRHSLGLVGVWEQEGKARLGIECYYTGRQRLEYDPYRDNSKPYVIFGIMGEKRVHQHAKLFLNLENLTNIRQTRWDPLLRPNRGRGRTMDRRRMGTTRRPRHQWRHTIQLLTAQREERRSRLFSGRFVEHGFDGCSLCSFPAPFLQGFAPIWGVSASAMSAACWTATKPY